MQRYFHVAVLCIVFLTSCYYDSAENLYPVTCDTTSVSYAKDVVPILTSNCLGCHTTGSPLGAAINLDNYTEVKNTVTYGSMLGSIKHDATYSAMPKNSPKMDACKISKITSWINAGAPNN